MLITNEQGMRNSLMLTQLEYGAITLLFRSLLIDSNLALSCLALPCLALPFQIADADADAYKILNRMVITMTIVLIDIGQVNQE